MKIINGIGLCVLYAACAVQFTSAAEIVYDFRGHPYDPELFLQTGPGASMAIRPDRQGLRIILPPEHGRKPAVGVVLRSGFQGDFEVTMEYEILQADEPKGGFGAGVSIWTTMVSYTKEAATIARVVRKDGAYFTSHRATTPDGAARKHFGGEPVTSLASSGKLRFVRIGSMLSYRVADGSSDDFQEIYATELGTEDIDTVRFAADSGGSPTLLDVLIKKISVKADDAGEPEPLPPRPSCWPLVITIVAAVLIVGGGYWYWSRR